MPVAETNADRLAQFIAGSGDRVVPEDVLDAARLCLADWVAVAVGAGREDAGRIVREMIAGAGSGGPATVIFGGASTPANAALANGTLAHCLDFDDTYIPAITHTSAPLWAAVLALAEANASSELEILKAFVTGFEVMARAGNGLGQGLTARGLHGTGVFGKIAAAAGSATLLRLEAAPSAHALALAATQVSGLGISFGTMAKPFHAGKAAMDGVMSADLAKRGFVGAPAALSRGGLDKALIQDGSLSFAPIAFDGWEILNNSFKPYAACHLVHPAVDAARSIAEAERANIKSVHARVSPLAMQITGSASGNPGTSLAAKFDLRYCIALGLEGHAVGARDFPEPWQADAAVVRRAATISAEADSSVGYAAAEVDVEFSAGSIRTLRIVTAKGHPGNPMTWDDMWLKFEALSATVLGVRTNELFETIRTFGRGGRREDLSRTLRSLKSA